MDNTYLQELINETKLRGGGLLLNYEDKPAVVVLTVDKYNSLLEGQELGIKNQAVEIQTSPKAELASTQSVKKVLVTGGAGYIGGHLVRELIKQNYEVVVLDNLSTGRRENIDPKAIFVEGDLADVNLLRDIFANNNISAVFHMAASLEVEESVREPEKYFKNNTQNTIGLLEVMKELGINKIIFSSTAAVYGENAKVPINENSPLHPNNPYGSSKLLTERNIKYFCEYLGFKAVIFRYFNACGFDEEANILPTHQSHLIYKVMQVAKGAEPILKIFGNDYETFDGTCIRDYVHVLDIVLPHILALEKLNGDLKFEIINIGTGTGLSVAQIVNGASEIIGRIIPMETAPRRAGDAPATVADNSKLVNLLGYEPKFSSLNNILTSSWEVLKKD
ncbi:MAG: UDP-glucose 4-epimerase GalE [Candidatus Doudnabacteria bacterium]|nr:UDP-glucose 4-epimerase GalE [Candidatus Doudnabacteria bacterium]